MVLFCNKQYDTTNVINTFTTNLIGKKKKNVVPVYKIFVNFVKVFRVTSHFLTFQSRLSQMFQSNCDVTWGNRNQHQNVVGQILKLGWIIRFNISRIPFRILHPNQNESQWRIYSGYKQFLFYFRAFN